MAKLQKQFEDIDSHLIDDIDGAILHVYNYDAFKSAFFNWLETGSDEWVMTGAGGSIRSLLFKIKNDVIIVDQFKRKIKEKFGAYLVDVAVSVMHSIDNEIELKIELTMPDMSRQVYNLNK